MRTINLLAGFLAILFVANCSGDYRPKAMGILGDAVVVMDSTQTNSETAQAIREVYGQGIETLPQWEPMMDLSFQDFKNNDELEQIRKNRNLIIAAPIDDSSNTGDFIRALLSDDVEEQVKQGNAFAFPLQNEWYKDQWTIILTSSSDSTLAQKIRESKGTLAADLMEVEMKRWTRDIYEKGEQMDMNDSLWINHGWKIRVQHDWVQNIDTSYTENGQQNNFLTIRRNLPDNQRWFWAWWIDDVPERDSITADWINTKRDSLMEKWIRGTRDSSYVTTDYEHNPVLTDSLVVDGRQAFETEGVWTMTNDAMAGPFVNLTVHDKHNDRLFMLEFGQFAPKYDRRRFVRQFQTMLRTFESDSSWNKTPNGITVGGD